MYTNEPRRIAIAKAAWTQVCPFLYFYGNQVPLKMAMAQERAEETIKTYLSFRKQGYSHGSIATHVFKARKT